MKGKILIVVRGFREGGIDHIVYPLRSQRNTEKKTCSSVFLCDLSGSPYFSFSPGRITEDVILIDTHPNVV